VLAEQGQAATAVAMSPRSNVEFCQASGSASVVDATYFGRVFSGWATAPSFISACRKTT
jgi:hypothetical protein